MMRLFSALALVSLAACSTYTQEKESLNYQPVFPADQPYAAFSEPTGDIYANGAPGLFVMDRRAGKVGDVLTVELNERFTASKTQSAGGSRSGDFEIDLPNALSANVDGADFTSGTSQSFSGNGSASQSNSLRGKFTVQVVRILPGGLLEIMGEKRMTLNLGHEYIRLTGMVRPEDISSDNIVASDRIANARIEYVGAGDTADTARQGWLRRGMNAVSPL